jgi:hypothetical protein
MYEYLMRAMVARKPMDYLGQTLQPGESFVATPVDGDYFIKCGRAEDDDHGRQTVVVEQRVTGVAVQLPIAAEQVDATLADTPPQELQSAEPVAQDVLADEASAESDQAHQAPVRRRGRPTNAERAARQAEQADE